MASRTFQYSSFVVMVSIVVLCETVEADPWGDARMSVEIRNELPGTLGVHCKSRDDDLQQRYLPAGGQPYYFTFVTNIWGSTLFWCDFHDGPSRWNVFDVWTGPGWLAQKKMPCEQCVWAVRTDGFYRAQKGQALVFVKPWLHT